MDKHGGRQTAKHVRQQTGRCCWLPWSCRPPSYRLHHLPSTLHRRAEVIAATQLPWVCVLALSQPWEHRLVWLPCHHRHHQTHQTRRSHCLRQPRAVARNRRLTLVAHHCRHRRHCHPNLRTLPSFPMQQLQSRPRCHCHDYHPCKVCKCVSTRMPNESRKANKRTPWNLVRPNQSHRCRRHCHSMQCRLQSRPADLRRLRPPARLAAPHLSSSRQHLRLRRGVPERRLPGLRLAASLLHCPHCQETCAASRGRHAPARSDLVAHLALGVCVEGAAKTPRTHTGAHQHALSREQADRRGPVGATCEGCTLSAHSRTLRHSDGVIHVRRYSSLLYTLVQPVAV